MITTTLKIFCQWKTLVPFYLRKKIPEKEILTLTVNYCKTSTEKQIKLFKKTTVNWLFNDVGYYLLIGYGKVGAFHKKVVRVYSIVELILIIKNWPIL